LRYFVWKITILRQKILFFPIAEGGAKIFEVFRVKNHDFTTKNHIFFNFRGGGRASGSPPLDRPWSYILVYCHGKVETLSLTILSQNISKITATILWITQSRINIPVVSFGTDYIIFASLASD
jgi:hypothetical protein